MEFFPLDSSIRSAFAVYSVCKCILKEKKTTFYSLLLCMRFCLSRKQPQYNDNGRPLPTYKCHNQLDIPETAPFDLTLLSA